MMINNNQKLIACLAVFVLLALSAPGLLAWSFQDQKAQFEDAMRQADKQYNSGYYRYAVEKYLAASKLAADRLDFSRAYFGQALSYFYLKDIFQSEKYIRMVLEVDPRKQISVIIHPISFVQSFERIRNEMNIPPPGVSDVEQVQAPATVPEVQPETAPQAQKEAAPPETKPRVQPPLAPAAAPTTAPPVLPATVKVAVRPGGYVEVTALVSSWSINLIKGLFEDSIIDKFSIEIRKVISDDLRKKYYHYSLVPISTYEKNLAFDSTGPNYGLELRYYSRGWGGSFSLGLSFEQTSMKLGVSGTVKQYYKDGSYAEADVEGSATASVFSTNVSFRWDMLPSGPVNPFFILGLGWAPFEADVTETYTGTFHPVSGAAESIADTTVTSVAEIASDNNFDLPDAFFIVHVGFGLKVRVYSGISALAEVGLWDGLLLRAGLAYRF
jgi:hypothetical protein